MGRSAQSSDLAPQGAIPKGDQESVSFEILEIRSVSEELDRSLEIIQGERLTADLLFGDLDLRENHSPPVSNIGSPEQQARLLSSSVPRRPTSAAAVNRQAFIHAAYPERRAEKRAETHAERQTKNYAQLLFAMAASAVFVAVLSVMYLP